VSKIKLIALFGESGTGKDTIQKWLVNTCEMNGLVSYTTRPRRKGEIDGTDYCFIDENFFKDLISQNRLLEYTVFNNWYYGTPSMDLRSENINVGVFNIMGINNIKLAFKDKIDVLPIKIEAGQKTRLMRALQREANPNCSEICRRFLADEKDFRYIPFDYEVFDNNANNDEFYGLLNRPQVKEFIKAKDN
jgi:guanylate kinase